MGVELHGLLELEKRYVALEGVLNVVPMNYNSLHVPRDASFGFQFSRQIELTEDRYQCRQEPLNKDFRPLAIVN